MATTQTGSSRDRGTPLPQSGTRPGATGRMTQDDKQERLDALKIVPQGDSIPKLKAQGFHRVVERYRSASAAEKEAKQEKDEAGKDLMAMLASVGRDKVLDGSIPVTVCSGKSASRLDPKKLYELGVSEDLIARATILGNEYQYVLVTEPKVKK